uniref:(northern house mosquito) hypothetical protein n=1 Tax=Culex pipiens TaxID=7175 RepID=A0A8D8HM82_CULPI
MSAFLRSHSHDLRQLTASWALAPVCVINSVTRWVVSIAPRPPAAAAPPAPPPLLALRDFRTCRDDSPATATRLPPPPPLPVLRLRLRWFWVDWPPFRRQHPPQQQQQQHPVQPPGPEQHRRWSSASPSVPERILPLLLFRLGSWGRKSPSMRAAISPWISCPDLN